MCKNGEAIKKKEKQLGYYCIWFRHKQNDGDLDQSSSEETNQEKGYILIAGSDRQNLLEDWIWTEGVETQKNLWVLLVDNQTQNKVK